MDEDYSAIQTLRGEADVVALSTPDLNPTISKLKNTLWIPPLVANAIFESKSYNPAVLIPILSTRFQEFDKSSTTVKACTVLRPVLEFLWGVHKKLVPPTTMAVDHSRDSEEWSSRLHFAYISAPQWLPPAFPPPPDPAALAQDPSISSMTEELRRIRDATEKHLLRDVQTSDMKKDSNGWDKLPDMVQNMILKLSATQDDVLPLEPCDSYQKVLKQTKILGVTMVLNLEMRLRKCQVDIPTTMANAIKTGNFQANSYLVAHSFSIFNVPFTDAANMLSCNKTELDILDEGEGIPKDMAKKLAENKFTYPDSTHLLRHQFNNWYGVLQICFGEKSLVAREARTWITHVDEFELAYNAHFKMDTTFGAKVLGAIDLAFFQLCDSCFRASGIHDVNFSKNCLVNLRDDIESNRFHENLPAYLVSSIKKKRDSDEDAVDDIAKKNKRFKDIKDPNKDKFRDLGDMVKNQQAVQEWLIPGGKYKSLFTKEVISTTPPFNESGVITCNKWHARGFCYERCDRRVSHKKFESPVHRSAYDTWIKALKAKIG